MVSLVTIVCLACGVCTFAYIARTVETIRLLDHLISSQNLDYTYVHRRQVVVRQVHCITSENTRSLRLLFCSTSACNDCCSILSDVHSREHATSLNLRSDAVSLCDNVVVAGRTVVMRVHTHTHTHLHARNALIYWEASQKRWANGENSCNYQRSQLQQLAMAILW